MRMKMDFEDLIKQAEAPFSGWDFSLITESGRIKSDSLPWSYKELILKEFVNADSLLDMGTGGGEFLSQLSGLPKNTAATEGYEPNIPIARERLKALNIPVYEVKDDRQLPFTDEKFGLIINRHESYVPSELERILKKGGKFITQQVGGKDNLDLNRLLGAPEDFGYAHWNLQTAVIELKDAGFTILEQKEAFPATRFYDIGAIIYFLKAIPWQIEDFTVEKYKEKLYVIHQKIKESGYIEVRSHRFYIECIKV